MFFKPFEYARVASVQEAAELLRDEERFAKIIAGGQSLLPMMGLGLLDVDVVVDVAPVPGLSDIEHRADGLWIGSMVRHRELEFSETVQTAAPLLNAAIKHVGSPRVRNRGTIGGSIAHCDPSAEIPLVMSVLEASYDVSNGETHRTVSALDFAVSMYTTDLKEDEILLGASVPALNGGAWGWGFHEVARKAGDFALAAAASLVRREDGVIKEARLSLSSVVGPLRCTTVEQGAIGKRLSDVERLLTEALEQDIDPHADQGMSAVYRKRLLTTVALRAMRDALKRSER